MEQAGQAITKADAEKKYPPQNQELIHPGVATRMILPALLPAHIRHIKSITARRLTTAGWSSTCVQRKYLYTPEIDPAS